MARSNPSTQPKRTARLSLLETGARRSEEEEKEEEMEPNPLSIVNTVLALKRPDQLIQWLGSEDENNSTQLIKFIAAVQSAYDKLAADYNTMVVDRDGLLAENNTCDEDLAQQHGVI